MFKEIDLLGAFMPGIAAWFFAALALFAVADVLLTKVGFYRLFWHSALVRFALFVIFFCGIGLAINPS
jgi:protein AaeX